MCFASTTWCGERLTRRVSGRIYQLIGVQMFLVSRLDLITYLQVLAISAILLIFIYHNIITIIVMLNICKIIKKLQSCARMVLVNRYVLMRGRHKDNKAAKPIGKYSITFIESSLNSFRKH